MAPDWDLVSKLVFPVITAIVVAAIGKRMENRPKLITYMAHAAGFSLPPVQGQQLPTAGAEPKGQGDASTPPSGAAGAQVNVHSIIIRNTGKKTAFNVRLGHNLPIAHYVIEPRIQHESKTAAAGGWGDHRPRTRSERADHGVGTITFPPLTWHQINAS